MARTAPIPGTGIDRTTGRILSGWDHVQQSLNVIFTTHFGERVLRRWFGSFVPKLLGQPLNPRTMLRFWTAIVVAIELWEPRFKVKKIAYPPAGNAPEPLREGRLRLRLVGEYRPRGHLGDFTPEGPEVDVAMPAPEYFPNLDFSDPRNTQFQPGL